MQFDAVAERSRSGLVDEKVLAAEHLRDWNLQSTVHLTHCLGVHVSDESLT